MVVVEDTPEESVSAPVIPPAVAEAPTLPVSVANLIAMPSTTAVPPPPSHLDAVSEPAYPTGDDIRAPIPDTVGLDPNPAWEVRLPV